MSFRPLHKAAVLLFPFVIAGAFSCVGQEKAAPATPPAKSSESTAPAPAQKNGLKQLEEDLFKPLKTFSPNSSLDGVFNTPSRPVPVRPPESKQAREKRLRDKDWVFMNPDELLASPSMEEIFNLPAKDKNGTDEQKLTPFEKYYRRSFNMDEKKDKDSNGRSIRNDGSNPQKGQSRFGFSDEEMDDSSLTPALRETQRKLKAVQHGERSEEKSGFFKDIFGLSKNIPTADELQEKKDQQRRMDEYKQIIGVPPAVIAGDSLNPLATLGKPVGPGAGGLPVTVPTVRNSGSGAQLGTIGGLPSSLMSPSSSAAAPAFSAPAPALSTEPPKPRTPAPLPAISARHRAF